MPVPTTGLQNLALCSVFTMFFGKFFNFPEGRSAWITGLLLDYSISVILLSKLVAPQTFHLVNFYRQNDPIKIL
jgi:hypothetical protein